jgi:hypothetical protein
MPPDVQVQAGPDPVPPIKHLQRTGMGLISGVKAIGFSIIHLLFYFLDFCTKDKK